MKIAISQETKSLIIDALLDCEHVSGGSGRYQNLRWDVRPDGELREFWDGNGWHVSDAVATICPRDFLEQGSGNDYTWETDEDEEAARDWIASNLLDDIVLEGGIDAEGRDIEPLQFGVDYEGSEVQP